MPRTAENGFDAAVVDRESHPVANWPSSLPGQPAKSSERVDSVLTIDPNFIQLYRSAGKNLGEPIVRLDTRQVLQHYEPEFASKRVFECLRTLVEAWLRDLAYHRKSANPPGSEELGWAGLLEKLEGAPRSVSEPDVDVIVFVETNFLMSVAMGHEAKGDDLLAAVSAFVRVAIPSDCYMESFLAFEDERLRRNWFGAELDKQIGQLRRDTTSANAGTLLRRLEDSRITNDALLNDVQARLFHFADRAAFLRAADAAVVVVGDLLEPADVYRVVSVCRRVSFGMSVSPGYLEVSVTMAGVARAVRVDALVNIFQMTVSQLSIPNTTPSLQQRQHWLSKQVLLGTHAARIAAGASKFFPGPVSERLQLVRCIHTRRGTGLRPRLRNRLEYPHGEVFVHLSRIHGEPRQAVS